MKTWRVSGRVVGADASACVGARVYPHLNGVSAGRVVTGADGRFSYRVDLPDEQIPQTSGLDVQGETAGDISTFPRGGAINGINSLVVSLTDLVVVTPARALSWVFVGRVFQGQQTTTGWKVSDAVTPVNNQAVRVLAVYKTQDGVEHLINQLPTTDSSGVYSVAADTGPWYSEETLTIVSAGAVIGAVSARAASQGSLPQVSDGGALQIDIQDMFLRLPAVVVAPPLPAVTLTGAAGLTGALDSARGLTNFVWRQTATNSPKTFAWRLRGLLSGTNPDLGDVGYIERFFTGAGPISYLIRAGTYTMDCTAYNDFGGGSASATSLLAGS